MSPLRLMPQTWSPGARTAMQVFVHDRDTGETSLVSVDSAGNQGNNASGNVANGPAISGDGRYVAFFSLASNLGAE